MSDRIRVLRESVEHLSELADSIGPAGYTSPAYPSEWTIADTFSHLGSGAVIGKRRFDDSVAHRDSDPAFNTSVWDEWNAKDPAAQVRDCLVSDDAFLFTLETATEEQRREFRMTLGPFAFDFDGLVGLRLSEHVLHAWDIEVSLYPQATLPNDAANAILDGIGFIVARTGKPAGEPRHVNIRTIEPARGFGVIVGADSVDLVETEHDGAVDLEIAAEALVRLIYGRLDEEHTPASAKGDAISYLRTVFPGL
jgi:uncharacterized protein (TIGR03083 family)